MPQSLVRPCLLGDRVSRHVGGLAAAPLVIALACAAPVHAAGDATPPPLMPWPAHVTTGTGVLPVGASLGTWLDGPTSPLVERAVERLARRLAATTGIPVRVQRTPSPETAALRVHFGADSRFLTLEADESYELDVTPEGADLRAAGETGVLRGLATLAQLVRPAGDGFGLAAASIRDRPRFEWRGLMLDTARHFIPMAQLERQLDAMEAVKLNVLHLHLSDAEAYRVESLVHPKLHATGSDGEFYTQAEVRALVERAADRGIRVVPELDMPSHTRSWLVGYPELASRPGPYHTGLDPAAAGAVLDPTREEVYAFVDTLVAELAGLFPDHFFHFGGDEVVGTEWEESPSIRSFMKANGIADRDALQGHFSRRAGAILAKHGRTSVGWDEVLDHGLPADVVLQPWRSSKLTARATAAGHRVVVSAGYYLDLLMPATYHYGIDPADPTAFGISQREREALASTPVAAYVTEAQVIDPTVSLSPAQEALILGGEVSLWTEMVTAEMLDGRLWPRAAAIAERLWSPRDTRDPDSILRRLVAVSRQLEVLGLRHEANRGLMLTRIAPGAPQAIEALGAAVAPSRFHSRLLRRMMAGPEALQAPLNRLADAATPESTQALRFEFDVRDMIAAGERTGARVERVRAQLAAWRDVRAALDAVAGSEGLVREALPVAADLTAMAEGGMVALDAWRRGERAGGEAVSRAGALAERHARAASTSTSLLGALTAPLPPAEVVVTVAPAIREILRAAGAP